MRIFRLNEETDKRVFEHMPRKTAVALGRFDAIHIGHIQIIKKTVEYARQNDLTSVVFMFDNDPTEVISGKTVPNVTSREKREEILKNLGAEVVIEKIFDREFMRLGCREFVDEYLHIMLDARYAAAGFNYRFGKGGMGDTNTLGEICGDFGIKTEIVKEVTLGGMPVSSTRIRKAMANGDAESAARMLGRFFSISGIISEGNHIGKEIGFATANIPIPPNSVIPKTGVYISVARIFGKEFSAITNVGSRPTVNEEKMCIETHIDADFDDLYGEKIEVEFCSFIREIKKFDGVDALKRQLSKDREKSRKYYKELKQNGGIL